MNSRVCQYHGLNCCIGQVKIETISAIKQYINPFGIRGISVTSVYSDNMFEKLGYILRPIHFEISARGDHVGSIRREVRNINQQCHCTTASVPYKRIPRIMIEANLGDKVHWHNIFTPKDYISQDIGP